MIPTEDSSELRSAKMIMLSTEDSMKPIFTVMLSTEDNKESIFANMDNAIYWSWYRAHICWDEYCYLLKKTQSSNLWIWKVLSTEDNTHQKYAAKIMSYTGDSTEPIFANMENNLLKIILNPVFHNGLWDLLKTRKKTSFANILFT